MQVDDPEFGVDGEVKGCSMCPLSDHDDCDDWMGNHNGDCPTATTYQEACDLADGQPMLPGL